MRRSRPAASFSGRASATGAIVAGGVLGAAFLHPALGFLAWFAFVPLLDLLDARIHMRAGGRALFRAGWAFGFPAFLIGIHWIARLSDVAITVPWLKYPAWLAAAAYLALFPGLAAALAGWLARRTRRSVAVTFPIALIVVEELRASGELGFPWFQPGYSQAAFAPVVQLASLGSVTLVTAWIAGVNVLLWRSFTGRARLRAAAGLALLFVFPWAYGARSLATAPREPGPTVALIQANVAGERKWSGRHQPEILASFLTLTAEAAARTPRPILAIWPETATGSWLSRQPEQTSEIAALIARTGVPIFSGYPDYDMDARGRVRTYNAAGVFDSLGLPRVRYAKRHLVPFGERMPFQWLIPPLGRLDLGQAEWTPGGDPVLFESAAGRFSCLICFESIFPDLARADVRRGARWIVNVTNDEWFGNSAALTQHAAMAQFRAVENRVPIARCANTGLTMLIDANGRIRGRLPAFAPGVLVAPLGTPGPATLFSRLGDWAGVVALIALLLMAFVPGWFARWGER